MVRIGPSRQWGLSGKAEGFAESFPVLHALWWRAFRVWDGWRILPSTGLAGVSPLTAMGPYSGLAGGGRGAEYGEGRQCQRAAPWAVQLRTFAFDAKGHCGGSLIRPNVVVTAAHCMIDQGRPYAPHQVFVLFGDNKGPRQRVVTARRVDVNPHFDEATVDNDIAVVEIPPLQMEKGVVETIPLYDGRLPAHRLRLGRDEARLLRPVGQADGC
ncbi:hypothetical protein GCM10010339_69070 [Streptomyces alanosinicus]|uniref:Peptidase S1 domain-containing protein n=1 Tax=Streptomyces alanosinicus TaxID=68171 RepID=A0A918YNR9_9ACTN|nr:hypothetical protein GCM10010339_69070 [Streptomyces alanosinicus]